MAINRKKKIGYKWEWNPKNIDRWKRGKSRNKEKREKEVTTENNK